MLALSGQVRGNTIVADAEDISMYDGRDVVITILDGKESTQNRKLPDIDDLVTPTAWGEHADAYVRELRDNDRL